MKFPTSRALGVEPLRVGPRALFGVMGPEFLGLGYSSQQWLINSGFVGPNE